MVRGGNNSKSMGSGRRGRPPKQDTTTTTTPTKQNESRSKSNSDNKFMFTNLDDEKAATPIKTPTNKNSINNQNLTNTTPQIRSARLSAKQNNLIKQKQQNNNDNNNSTTTTPKATKSTIQQQSSSKQTTNTSTTRSSKTQSSTNTRSTKKRKTTKDKWESSTDDEDDYEPANKRRGAYFESYRNSSYFDDENNEEEDETDDEFAVDDDVDDSLENGDDNNDNTISLNDDAADGKNKTHPWERAQRPNSPPRFNETNLPTLELPQSSQDLLLTEQDVDEYLMQICSVYEILKHFKHQLRLSSFRVEEFIASLQLDEMNSLLSEIHITLLKVLIKEDEQNATIICSNEVKDSINIHLYSCDTITWPQVLKMYLLARAKGALLTNNKINERSGEIEAKRIVQSIYNTCYPIGVDLGIKLSVLQYLCDSFLETNIAREEILNIESMTIKHDDHCRKCHKLGDLLCCDNCPSVWHLACVDPPITNVPNNEWICHICRAMNIDEIESATVRKEILGWDRHGRKYWWLCQRLIVEQENENDSSKNKVWYYSTRFQFNELINQLDKAKYEKELVEVLLEMNEEICKGFDTICQLTQNAIVVKGLMLYHVKSWIEICNEEAKLKEEEQLKKNEININDQSSVTPNTGIVTRTKTGAIHQTTRSHEITSSSTTQSNSKNLDAEDQNVLYVWDNDKGDKVLKRLNKKYIPNLSALLFKLGMEAKTYSNYFNVNMLALNKYQQQEERDRKRQLSYKFSMSPLAEFKWFGASNSSYFTLVQTLRKTFIHFENSLQSSFLHPNWSLHSSKFRTAINMCNNAKDFALALNILESSIKPVLFNPVWNESLGHNLLERTTVMDREERKKIEKRERREQTEEFDMLMRLGGVKYTLIPSRLKDGTWSGQGVGRGVHQLWKQRGEEYRMTGKNGWFWRSSTRVHHKCNSKREVLKTDELTEEEQDKVKNTETINVMRELRLNSVDDKRIYYPKKFNKKACPKLELIEGLLDKRIALKKALELEKIRSEIKDKESSTADSKPKINLVCYSSDCRNLIKQNKARDLKCYSHDCRRSSDKLLDNDDNVETIKKETEEVFYCVKPVYLYNTTSENIIQRKLNSKRLLVKGKLPPCSQFKTKSGKKSIFVLPNYELRKLSRSGALREVCGFSYTAKSNPYIWPFHSTPRPTFRTCWLYRNSIIEKNDGLESVALSLKIIWYCIRWDDMANKPSSNTITTETDIITTELLKRRDLAPFGIRSEYLVRKIVVPIEFDNEKDDEWRDSSFRYSDLSTSSKREGLRERKKKVDDNDLRKQGPSVTETWTPEEELQLWEIRSFGEKLEKQQQMIKERERERIQKENSEKARKALEEQRNAKKLLNGENARVTAPILQKSGQTKRIIAQNNNLSNQLQQQQQQKQQNQSGYAMIRTLGGQTYKIPLSALQGKKPGQQIVIKTGNPNSGQFTNTTTATIISTCTAPTTTPANSITNSSQQQHRPAATTTVSSTNTIPSTSTVRPLILSSSSNNPSLATGISASSLQNQPQKIQFIKQITAPTVNSNQITTSISKQPQTPQSTNAITTTANTNALTPTTPSTTATTTFKIIPNINAGQTANPNSQVQIPIKLPDGRMQIIQLPASMLNSSTPIQISIPQQTSSSSTNATTSTPTIIRTISAQNLSSITRTPTTPTTAIAAAAAATPTKTTPIIRTLNASSSNSSTTPIIRTITPIRTISSTPLLSSTIAATTTTTTSSTTTTTTATTTILQNNTTTNTTPIIQTQTKPSLIIKTETQSSQSKSQTQPPSAFNQQPISLINNNKATTIINSSKSNSSKTSSSNITSSTSGSSLVIGNSQKPLLQHQHVDDQLYQSDNKIKIEESSFQLTPQYKQEMVKAALSSKTNTPEIQQKLLALQKHTQQQQLQEEGDKRQQHSNNSTTKSIQSSNQFKNNNNRTTAGGLIRTTNRQMSSTLQMVQSRNKADLEEERDDIVVKTIIKAMIDRIEKDEKLELKRKKARENQMQAKWRQSSLRLNSKLSKNADQIKREMLKRRALNQQNINESVDQEIKNTLEQMYPNDHNNQITSPRNSDEVSENSIVLEQQQQEQPRIGDLKKKEEKCNKSMSSSAQDSLVMANNANCINSSLSLTVTSSPIKRKSTTPSINTTNNRLTNDDNRLNNSKSSKSSSRSSKSSSSSSLATKTKLIKSKASDALSKKFKKLKRPRLLSYKLSENQFNDQFYEIMDTVTETGNATNKQSQKRLYCICRQPYDSNRFMIGCDYCHNWYHCDCINLDEDKVKKMSSFICQQCRETHGSDLDDEYLEEEEDELSEEEHESDEEQIENNHQILSPSTTTTTTSSSNKRKSSSTTTAPTSNLVNGSTKITSQSIKTQQVLNKNSQTKQQQQQQSNKRQKVAEKQKQQQQQQQQQESEDDELYCICRTPYNESQFYVQCEKCDLWLHGRCIGLLSKEAEKIDVYLCPACDPSSTINYANQKKLDSNDYEQLKKLLKSIQQHKNAWPFLRPVDERQVPDYYQVIKEPMDLSTVESNLNKQIYLNLTKFIGDITQIFDNCHYYNDSKSSIVVCANHLENHFVGLIKKFRQQMIREHH